MLNTVLPEEFYAQRAVVLRDQNHRPNLLPLLGIAIIILVVFAWTFIL